MRRTARIGSAVLAAVVSLAAGEAPPLIPTRDVDVTYDLAGAAGTVLHERLRWDTAGHRLRVDPPGNGVYMITDYEAHMMSIVRQADRSIMEALAPAAGLPGTSRAPYQQDGSDTVAGFSCTEWATIDTEQHPVAVCVTPDGVLLRVRRDGRTLLSARQVTFATQDPALFRLPADYRRTSAIQPGAAP